METNLCNLIEMSNILYDNNEKPHYYDNKVFSFLTNLFKKNPFFLKSRKLKMEGIKHDNCIL